MAHRATLHISLSIPENRTQKYPKPPLSASFRSWYSRKFSKMKVFVFLDILFSDLRLGSSNRPTNYRDILKSVGEVVEKFLWNFGKTSSFLEGTSQTLRCNFDLLSFVKKFFKIFEKVEYFEFFFLNFGVRRNFGIVFRKLGKNFAKMKKLEKLGSKLSNKFSTYFGRNFV